MVVGGGFDDTDERPAKIEVRTSVDESVPGDQAFLPEVRNVRVVKASYGGGASARAQVRNILNGTQSQTATAYAIFRDAGGKIIGGHLDLPRRRRPRRRTDRGER